MTSCCISHAGHLLNTSAASMLSACGKLRSACIFSAYGQEAPHAVGAAHCRHTMLSEMRCWSSSAGCGGRSSGWRRSTQPCLPMHIVLQCYPSFGSLCSKGSHRLSVTCMQTACRMLKPAAVMLKSQCGLDVAGAVGEAAVGSGAGSPAGLHLCSQDQCAAGGQLRPHPGASGGAAAGQEASLGVCCGRLCCRLYFTCSCSGPCRQLGAGADQEQA